MAKMSSNVLLRQHAIMNAYKLLISFMCFFPMLFMKTVRIHASMFIFRQNSSSASFVTSSCVSWHICALTHDKIVFVLRKKSVCLNRYFCALEKTRETTVLARLIEKPCQGLSLSIIILDETRVKNLDRKLGYVNLSVRFLNIDNHKVLFVTDRPSLRFTCLWGYFIERWAWLNYAYQN